MISRSGIERHKHRMENFLYGMENLICKVRQNGELYRMENFTENLDRMENFKNGERYRERARRYANYLPTKSQ